MPTGGPRRGSALEYDYSSGDSNPTDGKHGTFDNLFPTNHKFYGYMDFVSLQNIQDVRGIFHTQADAALERGRSRATASGSPTRTTIFTPSAARRAAASPPRHRHGYGINPNYNDFVGTELDVIAGYAVTRFAQLEAGYGHFFTGNIHPAVAAQRRLRLARCGLRLCPDHPQILK